jgi:hypothetical protein
MWSFRHRHGHREKAAEEAILKIKRKRRRNLTLWGRERWLGLFEQARAIVKWSVCRFHRGGRVCLNRDWQRISGLSAGCFLELPTWDVTQGGRSPTGVMPQVGGHIHAAITIGRLSKYV